MSPIYEYRCKCGHVMEVFRGIHDRDKPIRCKECEGNMELSMSVNSKPIIRWS